MQHLSNKPTEPTMTYKSIELNISAEPCACGNAKGLNWLFGIIIVILITILLNKSFPTKQNIMYNNLSKNPEVIVRVVKEIETPLVNFTNNEKAALFLAFPFCFMILIGYNSIVKNRMTRTKIKF